MADIPPAYGIGDITSAMIPNPLVPTSGDQGVTGDLTVSGDVQGGTLTSDAGIALSGAITGATNITASGVLTVGDGTAADPSVIFTTSNDGFYMAASGQVAVSIGNASRGIWTSTQYQTAVDIRPNADNARLIGSSTLGFKTYFQTRNAIGAVSTDAALGIQMVNKAEALVGAQQYSSALVQQGEGWQTVADTSHPVGFMQQVIPVQGTGALPTGALHWFSEIDDAGWVSRMNLTSAGELNVSPDADTSHVLGHLRIHSATADFMLLSHNDLSSSSNYGVRHSETGSLTLNSTAAPIEFRINNVAVFDTTTGFCVRAKDAAGPAMYNLASGDTVVAFAPDRAQATSGLGGAADGPAMIVDGTRICLWNTSGSTQSGRGQFRANTDNEGVDAGRSSVGGIATDVAYWSHRDIKTSLTTIAISQTQPGATTLNSATGEVTTLAINNVAVVTVAAAVLTYADAIDMAFNTTTGTKIGTGSTQKLALWGATPVVQPAHIIDADGTLADITTKFNTLLADLAGMGAQAAS